MVGWEPIETHLLIFNIAELIVKACMIAEEDCVMFANRGRAFLSKINDVLRSSIKGVKVISRGRIPGHTADWRPDFVIMDKDGKIRAIIEVKAGTVSTRDVPILKEYADELPNRNVKLILIASDATQDAIHVASDNDIYVISGSDKEIGEKLVNIVKNLLPANDKHKESDKV